MNIANQERTTISTEGKEITFKCNSGTYYVPPFTEDERALMLESFSESYPFAILCTKVQNDRGSRPAERFGTPCMEDYDNRCPEDCKDCDPDPWDDILDILEEVFDIRIIR